MSFFDRKHGTRILLSVLSVVVDDPPMATMWKNKKFVVALAFAFSFLPSEGEVSLNIGLHQLCANFWVKIVVPRVGNMKKTFRFPCRHRSPELLLRRHFLGQPGRCVPDKHLLVRPFRHQNRNLQRK